MPIFPKTAIQQNTRSGRAFGQRYQTLASPAYDNVTYHLSLRTKTKFFGVRAWIRNNEPSAITVNAIAAAPSTVDSVPNTTGGTWNVGTFAGANSKVIPARLAANRVSHVGSDIIPCASLAAADGSGTYIAMVRLYNAVAPFSVNYDTGIFSAWDSSLLNPLARSLYANCAVAFGDFVSVNQTGFTGYATPADLCPLMDIEFLHATQVGNVVTIGDSIPWGAGASLQQAGYMFLAIADSHTSAMPISWQNEAVPGTTTTMFVQRLSDMLAAGFRPHILHYVAFSPNDGTPSRIIVNQQKNNLVAVLDMCRDYRIIPIIDTGIPNTLQAWSAVNDAFRVELCNFVRGLSSWGVNVLDIDSVTSTNASPARIIPAATTDLTHLNDVGHALAKAKAMPIIKSVQSTVFNGNFIY